HLPHGRARVASLAVLRAMRGRLHPRFRRPDADHRLHGRDPGGGVTAEPASSSRRHLYWLFGIWLALSAVAVPLVIFVLGPQLPPGSMTVEAHGQTQANIVMTATIAPVFLLVVVFF